jgi:aspartyl-tRNA(Asn)/glutamyl-tRNA(Gln) amidotransferase subunit B
MRSKEEAHDYRYFPEPDLPPLVADAARVGAIARDMPELPDARRQRFLVGYGLPAYDVGQLTQSRATADYFEGVVRSGASAKIASNWLMGELARALNASAHDISTSPLPPGRLAELLVLVEKGEISGAIAKTVFEKMFSTGRSADEIVKQEGLTQIDDEPAIAALIDEVLSTNSDAVAQYRGGKASTFGFLVGQVMKRTSGKANPKRVNEVLKKMLDGQKTGT